MKKTLFITKENKSSLKDNYRVVIESILNHFIVDTSEQISIKNFIKEKFSTLKTKDCVSISINIDEEYLNKLNKLFIIYSEYTKIATLNGLISYWFSNDLKNQIQKHKDQTIEELKTKLEIEEENKKALLESNILLKEVINRTNEKMIEMEKNENLILESYKKEKTDLEKKIKEEALDKEKLQNDIRELEKELEEEKNKSIWKRIFKK